MVNTAAGTISVISQGRAASRGNTTVWFGQMADGRFVVTSRFQWEVRTKDRSKAESVFLSLCGA
jgi:hypothetical protein